MLGTDLSPAWPLLFAGREARTISQILADQNLRKQNDYVEVKAWGAGTAGLVGRP